MPTAQKKRPGRNRPATATHRPATVKRRYRHDTLTAVDLFSGFGGLTRAIQVAGFSVITAANHSSYKVEIHEANHPDVEHWIADLVDKEAADYHSARDLPRADLLVAGVSCTNHSQANTTKAYEQRLSLLDLVDPDFDERVTRSEKDRATANCVLHYAQANHPRMILVECTTELTSWGPAIIGRPKVGDGTTYRWWLKQLKNLGYRYKVLYLNSQFFDVPQSRDRIFIVLWDESVPTPDLEHQPMTWCGRCDEILPAVWTWKTGIPPTGSVRYGKQYIYCCPRCRREVVPPMAMSINAIDLSDLGTRIGDKPVKTFKDGFVGPLARATMERAERCRTRFPDFPAVLMPAKANHGVERHLGQPMPTQTSQQEAALLHTGNTYERPGSPVAVTGHVIAAHQHNGDGKHISQPMDTVTSTHERAVVLASVNFQGIGRGADEPLPTQCGSENMGLLAATGVMPYRQHTEAAMAGQPMATVTADQTPALLTAAGFIKNNGGVAEAKYRSHPLSDPLGTVTASGAGQAMLFPGWEDQPDTSADAEWMAQWRSTLAKIKLEDCYFRMLGPHEVGRGCGFDTTFPGHVGEFQVWGSARDQVDGFGNAVSPQVGTWIGLRLRAALHGETHAGDLITV